MRKRIEVIGMDPPDLCTNCKYYVYWNHMSRKCKERNKIYKGHDACWEESEKSKENRLANRSW